MNHTMIVRSSVEGNEELTKNHGELTRMIMRSSVDYNDELNGMIMMSSLVGRIL